MVALIFGYSDKRKYKENYRGMRMLLTVVKAVLLVGGLLFFVLMALFG